MIEKELYSPPTDEDKAIMVMAKNQIELDEVIMAKEFLEALEEAREKGSDFMYALQSKLAKMGKKVG